MAISPTAPETSLKPKDLLAYRVGLFRDAANWRTPERVPHFCNAVTWKVFDAGESLPRALTDFDTMARVMEHFFATYRVDGVMDYGIRNQFTVTEAFASRPSGTPGGSYYYFDDDAVGIRDHAHCKVDTLAQFLEDPAKYLWEVALPEKYPDWNDKTVDIWQRTFDEYVRYFMFIMQMSDLAQKRFGVPAMAPNNPSKDAIEFGIEELMANYLGIRNLSLALRRKPAVIKDFVDRWDETHITPLIAKVKAAKGPDKTHDFDASIMMLAPNILSPKQFEELYFCHLEPLLDAYEEKGMNVRLFCEGSILRFAEYFKKYRKGTLTMHIENDDPWAMREALPNVCLMGGITSELMGGGTPDEVVALAQKLIDELGREGGFILTQDKMMSYRNDCTAENLHALCDFANGYYLRGNREKSPAVPPAVTTAPAQAAPCERPARSPEVEGAFAPFAAYPEGQLALLAQLKKNVKMRFPFNVIPWKSLKPSLMPLLVKILIDG